MVWSDLLRSAWGNVTRGGAAGSGTKGGSGVGAAPKMEDMVRGEGGGLKSICFNLGLRRVQTFLDDGRLSMMEEIAAIVG